MAVSGAVRRARAAFLAGKEPAQPDIDLIMGCSDAARYDMTLNVRWPYGNIDDGNITRVLCDEDDLHEVENMSEQRCHRWQAHRPGSPDASEEEKILLLSVTDIGQQRKLEAS